ncbi:SDR family NAD(P)-dependent oxidoreductase [Pseudonocardia broussonetiae]|uniref:SDR family NAD(P)-dependent oxidoreductase n=1 Tax=Pseudonocardia broussonetiae TaxID=2736640 RepID=A0A6M6JCF2_9PSEU|nr:SDR family NAD(P)-dependent oxidoreductase [Pseudonocardia broussonetiae]QJY44750.1 SDR family NAD(P)-dependent oxidoreductase [Pseudonocardia broussonetiae]
MTETTVALVTGANKGLGRTAAQRLAALGWTVLVGARDAAKGAAAAAELGVEAVTIDVTDGASVEAAAKDVEQRFGRLDVLVNNAGIAGAPVEALDATADDVRAVLETNVLGPVRVTRAFLPLLRRSAAPRIVNVSSGLGSLAVTTDPERFESTLVNLPYTASKSALNMLTTQYAKALPGFRVNAVDPGYTATDLNGNSGPQTVEEGTDAIVELAQVAPDGPTGGFYDRSGVVPW